MALLDFTVASAPGSREARVADYAHAVQAGLLAVSDYEWVERQELDRLMAEHDLVALDRSDAGTAVRLGHLARADIILRGEIDATNTGPSLNLEAVDMRRAEVLAARGVPVTGVALDRISPTKADIAAAVSAAVAVLDEARQVLGRTGQRTLAPLYFKAYGPTSRLGFLETRFNDALAAAARQNESVRLLRFPRSVEAGEEAALVLSGLTDTRPDAVQQVADCYVWGSFTERDSEGVVLGDVTVVIDVQVWNGEANPVSHTWSGKVRDVAEGMDDICRRIVTTAVSSHPLPGTAFQPEQRKRVADLLASRAAQLDEQMPKTREGLYSATGRQYYALRQELLDTASFFMPLDRDLQLRRLAAAWNFDNPLQPLRSVPGWWRRTSDLTAQAAKFERRPDGTLDETWPRLRSDALFEFIVNSHLGGRVGSRDYVPMGGAGTVQLRIDTSLSNRERYRLLRATIGLWSRTVAAYARLIAFETHPPDWAAALRRKWADQLIEIQATIRDPLVLRDAFQEVWPAIAAEVGHRLRDAAAGTERDPPLKLFEIYRHFGADKLADRMLEQAWNASAPPTTGPVAAPTKPGPFRTDLAWDRAAAAAGKASATHSPDLAILGAKLHAIRLHDPVQVGWASDNPKQDPLQELSSGRVTQLAWFDGRLWIAEEGVPIASAAGFVNPQGKFALWTYDPATHVVNAVTPKLGGHGAVTALLPAGDSLWLGTATDGIWRLGADGAITRFSDADGVAGTTVYSGASAGNQIFFLGGKWPEFVINRHVEGTGWSAIRVPIADDEQRAAVQMRAIGAVPSWRVPPHLAVSGDSLGFSLSGSFLQISARSWSGPRRAKDVPGGPQLRFSGITGDEAGFWVTNDGGFGSSALPATLSFVDAAAPEARPVWLKLWPARVTAAVHHGPWLWLLMDPIDGNEPAVALVDKRSHSLVGRINLPMQNPSTLWAADDRLWVGSSSNSASVGSNSTPNRAALLEVRLDVPRPSVAPSPSTTAATNLHIAVRQPDAEVFARALTTFGGNAVSPTGWTALMAAVEEGSAEYVGRLLAAGADPNAVSVAGESALGLAVEQGDLRLAELLLDRGAEPNHRMRAKLLNVKCAPKSIALEAIPFPSAALRQPATLQAGATEFGTVKLTWDDRSDGETHYEVSYWDGAAGRNVARLPRDSTTWIDEEPRTEPELRYRVTAVNDLRPNADGESSPEAKLKRPTPPPEVHQWNEFAMEHWLPRRFLIEPPLSLAVRRGNEAMVRLLLAHGADPNLGDAAGTPALLLAVRRGWNGIARQLLAAGAQAGWAESSGATAASVVYARHEDRALLQLLLDAQTPAARRREATALIATAAGRGQIADIEWLAAQGGDLGNHVVVGRSAFAAAEANGQTETAAWLAARLTGLLGRWSQGHTLHNDEDIVATATMAKDVDFFRGLLQAGVSPDLQINGAPLAVIVARHRGSEVLELLWREHADFNARGEGSASALETMSRADAVRFQVPFSGIDMPAVAVQMRRWQYPSGYSPRFTGPEAVDYPHDPLRQSANDALLAAGSRGDLPGVMAALAQGAEIEATNPAGRTALIEAVTAKSLAVVRWLTEEGADVDHLSQRGASPLSFAVQDESTELADYLIDAGADPNRFEGDAFPPLALAIDRRSRSMVERLLDAGADPNYGWRHAGRFMGPLALAAQKGDEGLVDLLAARGADPRRNFHDYVSNGLGGLDSDDGRVIRTSDPTTLMYAIAGKNMNVIKKLVALGQDPRVQTSEGYDALAWAAGQGDIDAVKYLLPLSEKSGRALELARNGRHMAIATLLETAGYK